MLGCCWRILTDCLSTIVSSSASCMSEEVWWPWFSVWAVLGCRKLRRFEFESVCLLLVAVLSTIVDKLVLMIFAFLFTNLLLWKLDQYEFIFEQIVSEWKICLLNLGLKRCEFWLLRWYVNSDHHKLISNIFLLKLQ